MAAWGFTDAYAAAQSLLVGHIFVVMLVASFTPLPDKAFIYAAGILGAPFAPFLLAFIIGRGLRMSVVVYLVWHFGAPILEAADRYFVYATVVVVALVALYATVHWNLLALVI